uniref:Tyrosyl-DNA phosphodiesterase 1 n=1 Tax=Oncorhynchus kisutch TaxID=8019 RepID=A0A8C7KIX2_ONCKI
MSQASQHGKWTLSSSDDDNDDPLPSASNNNSPLLFGSPPPDQHTSSESNHNSPKIGSNFHQPKHDPDPPPSIEVKPEPKSDTVTAAPPLSIGSEARHAAQTSQLKPVKYESNQSSPFLAGKRKKDDDSISGWALSDSDDDDKDKGQSSGQKDPPPKRSNPKLKKAKVEERPPSPHGRTYYIDEPDDFFETSVPPVNDTYRFYLNKVTGLEKRYNTGALHIKEILSPLFGTLKESVQFNYCFDIAWMLQQYPPEFRDKPVLIVHGDKREAKARLLQQAQPYSQVRFCQAKLDIAFGTHHTKMMLLWYEEGFRVVILTSNMIRADWYQKTQGLWMSPLYLRLPKGSPETAGESPTLFKQDLLEYLGAYRAPEIADWIQRIREHDLSETRVYLIGSTPGRYLGSDMERWGHLRLRKLLRDHTRPIPNEEKWPVIGQFSSIGSMGLDKTKWLAGEFQRTLTTLGKSSLRPDPPMHLVRSIKHPYCTSPPLVIVVPAGGSLPYSIQTAQKQIWLHIVIIFSNLLSILCVCSPVPSANLSKAAWGALEKNNTQVMVRSYELGVLYVPSAFSMSTFPVQMDVFPATTPSTAFPVPFDLPPKRYSSKDHPWMWNIPYTQAPDTHGNIWVPS